MSDKSSIRKEVLRLRDGISGDTKSIKDRYIFDTLASLPQFANARSIIFYVSFGSEVDTINMIERCLFDGITVAAPKVIKSRSELEIYHIVSLSELVPGAFGILEPQILGQSTPLDPMHIDLIIVPGIAFDEQKNRLGYGKGYYDKLLAPVKAVHKNRGAVVALAYEEQIVQSVPCEPHDIKMDMIITDKRVIN